MGLLYLVFFRLSRVLIVVFGLVVVVFILTRTLTDPVDIILGPNSSLEQRTRINSELGFDRPLWEQFGVPRDRGGVCGAAARVLPDVSPGASAPSRSQAALPQGALYCAGQKGRIRYRYSYYFF